MKNSNPTGKRFIIHATEKKPKLPGMGEDSLFICDCVNMFPKFMSYLYLSYFSRIEKQTRYNVFTLFSN